MSPQLISAVVERIKASKPATEIINELIATGYSPEMANEAYVLALNQLNPKPEMAVPRPPNLSYPATASLSGTELISFNDLFTNSWQLAKEQTPVLFKMGLGLLGVVAVLVGLFFSWEINLSWEMMFVIFFIVPFLFLLLFIFVFFILMRALIARNLGQTLTAHTGWVFRNLWKLLLVFILTSIIIQIGFMLLFIPGVIALVYLMFSTCLVIDEKATVLGSIKLSINYVKGRFFALLGRLLVINIFVTLVSGVALLMFALISSISPFLILPYVPFFVLLMYWSICGLVVLYESVRSLSLSQ